VKTPRTQLAQAIGERTLHERDTAKLAREIAAYLLSENREHELESLMRDVLAYRQAHGVVEATLLTAHELGAGVDQQVKQLLKEHYPKAKHVIVREARDENVVGGLKVQMAHEQLDMSVRAKLDTFKRLTTEGNL
jgi:F0F1-type ATP synthase delta subunit